MSFVHADKLPELHADGHPSASFDSEPMHLKPAYCTAKLGPPYRESKLIDSAGPMPSCRHST
jgi:hypothetical protein